MSNVIDQWNSLPYFFDFPAVGTASCELLRHSAYIEDLHYQMVWQRQALGYTYQNVAENLGVDKSTVYRTFQLFESSGSIEKRKYPQGECISVMSTPVQLLILNLVVGKPGIYLHEVQRSLHDMLMIDVDLSTICRFLKNNGLTRQVTFCCCTKGWTTEATVLCCSCCLYWSRYLFVHYSLICNFCIFRSE